MIVVKHVNEGFPVTPLQFFKNIVKNEELTREYKVQANLHKVVDVLRKLRYYVTIESITKGVLQAGNSWIIVSDQFITLNVGTVNEEQFNLTDMELWSVSIKE